jgi:hypothetical protein
MQLTSTVILAATAFAASVYGQAGLTEPCVDGSYACFK